MNKINIKRYIRIPHLSVFLLERTINIIFYYKNRTMSYCLSRRKKNHTVFFSRYFKIITDFKTLQYELLNLNKLRTKLKN